MDFFDQICQVIAETENRRPGSVARGAAVEEFFSSAAVPPVQLPEKKSVPAAVPEKPTDKVVPGPAAAQRQSGNAAMDELQQAVAQCRQCQLCMHRTNPVFGEGSLQAKLMFIGEGPGADEDRTGRPFVGKAGQLLDKMICAMQFSREEVYIANIVKCRPPDNRLPAPDEAVKCLPFLHAQIDIIRPEVIVLLGATAVKFLLNTPHGISRMRGRWASFENIPVMPTFHPAFLLRQESAKREAWQDLQMVMARFGKFHRK